MAAAVVAVVAVVAVCSRYVLSKDLGEFRTDLVEELTKGGMYGKSAAGALSQQEEAGGAAAESDEPTSLVMVGAGVGGLVGVVALSMLVHKGYQSCTGETSYGSIIDDADDDFVEGYEEKQPIIETFTNSMSRDQQSADADAPSVAERSI